MNASTLDALTICPLKARRDPITALELDESENAVTLFTSLDTVRIVLDVLEEITNKISTIDAE